MPQPPNFEGFRSLLEGPTPAVIATYRKNGAVKLSPVWFRLDGDFFEVVIADDDVKLKHITQDQRVTLLIFESTAPFRGIQVSANAEVSRDKLDETRRSISARYLEDGASREFTERRAGTGAVVRIPAHVARTWDLSSIVS